MTVYLHKCMEMPMRGYSLSDISTYWDFDEADFFGDGDEDDSDNTMLFYAAKVYNDKPGTWMVSTDNPNHWRDAAVEAIGPMLQCLPLSRVWWADFAAFLQLVDDQDIYHIVRLAYMVDKLGASVGEAVLEYTKLGFISHQYETEESAKHGAAIEWLGQRGENLENTGYETAVELFDNEIDGDYYVYHFMESWYVLVSEGNE